MAGEKEMITTQTKAGLEYGLGDPFADVFTPFEIYIDKQSGQPRETEKRGRNNPADDLFGAIGYCGGVLLLGLVAGTKTVDKRIAEDREKRQQNYLFALQSFKK